MTPHALAQLAVATRPAPAPFWAVHRAHVVMLLGWVVVFTVVALVQQGRGPARGSWDRAAGLLAACAGASVLSGVAHLLVIREHFAESALYGWFFLLLTVAQLAYAALVVTRPSQSLVLAGVAASSLVVLLWLATRTVGIPLGAAAGEVEPVGGLDVLASAAELVVATCGLLAWRAALGEHRAAPTEGLHPA